VKSLVAKTVGRYKGLANLIKKISSSATICGKGIILHGTAQKTTRATLKKGGPRLGDHGNG